jgi:cystathionine beta-lyase/cystathionine gamma-synthase
MAKHDERDEQSWDLDTRLIHAHQAPDPTTGAVTPPIHMSTTFVRDRVDHVPDFTYSRADNPTRVQLEKVLAGLEYGAGASAFSSGMAAIYAAMQLLSSGDHAIVGYDCYLTTYDLFANDLPRYGVEATFVDLTDIEAVHAAVQPNTRMIWTETPANPLLNIIDLQEMVSIASQADAIVVVDNTFASPYCQNPLKLGADIVVHSTTKYLGGHSDVVGGAAISKTAELAERIKDRQYNLGAVPSPFDAWLLMRGMRTLGVRMRQHLINAQAVAEFLHDHPKVTKVRYPGLPDHPNHELAKRQMTGGFSAMVSFEVDGGAEAAKKISEAAKIFQLATSLGGVESLIYPPTAWMQASNPGNFDKIPGSPWTQYPGLIRMSVGIESTKDLIADLDQALG